MRGWLPEDTGDEAFFGALLTVSAGVQRRDGP
jgi:hypothetical protein